LLLSLIVFVFLSASVMLASFQVTHARRLTAEHGKLQAKYAAESSVFAAFDTKRDLPSLMIYDTPELQISGQAVIQSSGWIEAVGTVRAPDGIYSATARGYVTGNQIVMWEFN
jgi:hypothetical protein